MKTLPQKVIQLTTLLFVIFVLFSCGKDTDLLLDTVLNDPELAVEEGNFGTEQPAAEAGFVIRTFAFSPINDAYLQASQGYDRSIVRLEKEERTSFLMFDLSQVNGPIKDVVLQFSIDSDEGDGSISVHKGTSNTWTEESLTETNAPDPEVQLGTINKAYKVGGVEKVALTASDIQPEITTLVMKQDSGNDLAFASKEHPAQKGPKLIVTYTAPEGSPQIVQEEEATPEQPDEPEEIPQPSPQPKNENVVAADAYYVTTNGKASNDGKSEATAWTIEQAFSQAMAGDVVYIKAGNYGSKQLEVDNSGTSENPIKFIGYTNSPGDLISNQGSTFKYGDQLDSNKMPLLSSSSGTAITIHEPFVYIENIQVTGYNKGIMAHSFASNFSGINLIFTEMGTQNVFEAYDGWGIDIRGDYSNIENVFVLNAAAEAVKLSGASNSSVKYTSVYANNSANPTDYYFFLAGGTNNTIIENCHAQREQGLPHGGHGFNVKNDGAYNTFKNCTAIRTNFELTYSGVHHNTIDGGAIYGINTSNAEWHAVMSIIGGAHDNLIKNLYIQDTWTAITLATYNDRSGVDAALGINNTFENVTVKNTNRVLNIGSGTNYNAKAKNYTFKNCDFSEFGAVAVVYYGGENFKFENCSFNNGNALISRAEGVYMNYNNLIPSWINCNWSNVNFTPPN